MNLVLPDSASVRLEFLEGGLGMSDDAFFDWCQQNRDLRIERFQTDEVVVMSPPGFEAEYRGTELIRQIGDWALESGSSCAVGSNAGFLMPDGSVLSPDAALVNRDRLKSTPIEDRRKFLPVVPDLVVEVPSPSDVLAHVRRKIALWMEHGVRVALLVDADARSTEIWRQSGTEVSGENRICLDEFPGLCLELDAVWRGLGDED